MPRWTKEQQQAIDIRGQHVIVSAGAGSGKTAVLTERVYQMIKEGYPLSSLIVLTFTNAAAFEMRERIRKKLLEDEHLAHLAHEIDTSYIMTFDAFAYSLVRKYHYLLDLRSEVSITDESLIRVYKQRLLDDIFDEYYACPTPEFTHLISSYVSRDDQNLKKFLLQIDRVGDLKLDRDRYFHEEIPQSFQEEKIIGHIKRFYSLLRDRLQEITLTIPRLENTFDQQRVMNSLQLLLSARDYDELYQALQGYQFPRYQGVRGEERSEEDKKLRLKISAEMKKIVAFSNIGNQAEIIARYQSLEADVNLLISMVEKMNCQLDDFKRLHQVFTFSDIARFAITLLAHPAVAMELKTSIQAVMVDEYQDTSDIQEAFLNQLAGLDLYMVGDIKQSIYRFRNANCTIFQEKYDQYSQQKGGVKIDLNENFRSRPEVIEDINHLFSYLMRADCGGANYAEEHRIIAGNHNYVESGKSSENYHMEIYTYDPDDRSKEVEAELIADDIIRKVNTYPIFDKDALAFHPAQFRDFAILMDRKSSFDIYRRIFEERHIPVRIEKDDELISSPAVTVLANLLRLYETISTQNWSEKSAHAYASVYRSFIFEGDDHELEEIVLSRSFAKTALYQRVLDCSHAHYQQPLSEQVIALLDAFDFEHKLCKIGDVEAHEKKLEQLVSVTKAMEKMGYTTSDFIRYLDDLKDYEVPLTSTYEDDGSDSVRLLSIHKSKGLEFPIVYYSGLSSRFHNPETQNLFVASATYGILLPVVEGSQSETLFHHLVHEQEKADELSEKIRLLYVALTRSKEKMILFARNDFTPALLRSQSRCLLDLFYAGEPWMGNFHHQDLEHLVYTPLQAIEPERPSLKFQTVTFDATIIQQSRASSTDVQVDEDALQFGEKLHRILEMIDLKNPDLSFLKAQEQAMVQRFLAFPILHEHLDSQIYHEYAYLDEKRGVQGVIDLLLISDQEAIIIDFKTSHLDPKRYEHQLSQYREYVEHHFHRPTRTYLYSLLQGYGIEVK